MPRWSLFLVAAALCCTGVQAKVVTKSIEYQHEGQKLVGYLAYDDAKAGPRPGVLVIHEWWGLNDYTKGRARQLAGMGYVAFAADMFGDGQSTTEVDQAKKWYGAATGKPGLLAARSKAGLEVLRKQPQLDAKHVAAIGFCFGGTTVLQLAYSGEPLQGIVTFHGGLVVPDEAQAKAIRTPVLILTGAEDGFVKPEAIEGVRKAFDAANVDWYMVTYANAKHAFTNPDADKHKDIGLAYNEKAAKRSWEEMGHFFRAQLGAK